ncbi:MAG: MATE family efflux transporter [Spirochaetales bacterium]|nr:MATE family efflux transporter [Spirochaetales bacterium]
MKDLSVGNPKSVLIKFTLPLLGSMVFQQLYNIADSFVAGKFINGNALAAVSNGYEVTLIYLSFAFGCNMGCAVIVGQLYGAKDYTKVKTCINTAFISTAVLCLTLMGLGFLFTPALLRAIATPNEVFADSMLYLNIYTAGLIFLFLYNISNAIFSALGDSKTPFIFLAVSSVVNIFMDIWFVRSFGMGIAGIAWATFLCQGVSGILSVITVFIRIRRLECAEPPKIFSGKLLGKMIYIAIPSTMQQAFVSVGNIVIQSLINGFGTFVMSGYGAAVKINNFAVSVFGTLGNAVSCYTSQNIGAGQMDRVRRGFSVGLRMALLIAVTFSLTYILGRHRLIRLFTEDNKSGTDFLMIISPFFVFVAAKLTSDAVLRGAGAMGWFMITTFTDLILRVVLAFIFSKEWGYIGIWFAWPIGWIVSASMSALFYWKGVWKKE